MNAILKINMLLCALGLCFTLQAQLNIGGRPRSFSLPQLRSEAAIVTMPPINFKQLIAEDKLEEEQGLPPRFGYPFEVNLNLNNAGNWTTLDNGDRIWKLHILSPAAKSINLTYRHFWLPQGATLHIYNEDRSHVIGGFSSRNNKGTREEPAGFATGLVYGEQITLEYYEPATVKGQGILDIRRVVHGYRYIKVPSITEDFGDAGDCQVNINCMPEGEDWQAEKHGVALILVDGIRWCTGALLITTQRDWKPYFLTANHCLPTGLDAVNSPLANDWTFIWGYESPECDNPRTAPTLEHATAGAMLMANNANSDFALFRLIEDPRDLSPGIPRWYNSWDASGASGTGGVGIHHPRGDIKKISTHNMAPITTDIFGEVNASGLFWQVNWLPTTNGHSITQRGSSGSPLFNRQGRIIGQLYGGSRVDCADPANDPGRYGKFSVSWTGNGSSNPRRRLRDWLDPECIPNRSINDTYAEGGHAFYAGIQITSEADIRNNTLMDMTAGQRIRLLPGFRAARGAHFIAEIRACQSSEQAEVNELDANMRGAGTCVLPSARPNLVSSDFAPKLKIGASEAIKVFPNPLNDQATVQYTLQSEASVNLEICNLFGQTIKVLQANVPQEVGEHNIEFSAQDLPSGVYYLTLRAADQVITRKLSIQH